MALVHVYGQLWEHAEAWPVGNRSGLGALRGALESALSGEDGVAEVFAADGEGCGLVVLREDNDGSGSFWSRAESRLVGREEAERLRIAALSGHES